MFVLQMYDFSAILQAKKRFFFCLCCFLFSVHIRHTLFIYTFTSENKVFLPRELNAVYQGFDKSAFGLNNLAFYSSETPNYFAKMAF